MPVQKPALDEVEHRLKMHRIIDRRVAEGLPARRNQKVIPLFKKRHRSSAQTDLSADSKVSEVYSSEDFSALTGPRHAPLLQAVQV